MGEESASDHSNSDDESAELSGSDSSRGEAFHDGSQGGRVSLGSLMGVQHQSNRVPHMARLPCSQLEARHPGDDVSVHDPHCRTGDPAQTDIWFHGSHMPADQQEVLSWHPNRVRATLATELHFRIQHITPRRSSRKGFDPIIAFQSIIEPKRTSVADNATWTDRVRGRDLYVRVLNLMTGVTWADIRKSHKQAWADTTVEDKNQWFLLWRIMNHRRIAPVVRFPVQGLRHTYRQQMDLPETDKRKTQQWSGYGFVLSYNTSLGQEDPDVIKLVQSGKTGEDLLKSMKALSVYRDAFTDLWEYANQLAESKKLPTVNIGMEHSSHGDHEARVHFHVFIGPDLRGGVGFGEASVLKEVHADEIRWKGIRPNVKPTRPQKKSWNQIYQAVATGSYYVAGPKIGSIMQRSTFKPIEDSKWLNNHNHVRMSFITESFFYGTSKPCIQCRARMLNPKQ